MSEPLFSLPDVNLPLPSLEMDPLPPVEATMDETAQGEGAILQVGAHPSLPHSSLPLSPASSQAATKPFTIVCELQPEGTRGDCRPVASLQVHPSLRTSGLLQTLPPEDLKSLLMVLTFVHPNGYCQPTLVELAQAMQVTEGKVRARMERLVRFLWQGKPLLIALKRESGLDGYTPSPELLAIVSHPAVCAVNNPLTAPYGAAGREAVIAYSRTRYARPRAEVEREIARLNGWDVPEAFATEEEKAAATLRQQLLMYGISRTEADELLARYDPERLLRQLVWMPYRNAKSPSRFLLAAIEGDYEEPFALRHAPLAEEDTPLAPPPPLPEEEVPEPGEGSEVDLPDYS